MNKIFQNYLSLIMICLFAISAVVNAQKAPDYTSGKQRLEAYEQRKKMSEQSVLGQIEHTNIGPTVMSGRVVDLAVNPDDPTHFYVAYASGGLWYTNSNGTTMTPVFDNQAVMTIGDIAVDWGSEEHTIWLGTGENNSSRSSYAGVGMYKSEDSGKTWSYIGLPESHHIGRIVLHPADKNIAWVGVLGHLYSSNKERGVYKTTDGGNTWEQTLFVNNETGIIDLIMAPDNNEVLYAAAWERSRRAWNFVEGGSSSGIYKSTDGGENWTLISTKDSGFPMGEGVGRIGLDIHPNGTLYAALDNQFRKEKEEEDDKDALTKDDLRNMSKSAFLALGEDKIEDYLQENGFPRKYNTKKVIGMVKAGTILPKALVEYTEDANRLLFDTPVIGIEVYRSNDGGQTWAKTHDEDIKNIYNSYGYYFGQIRVAPTDVNTVYIMGVPIMRSDDGGKTFKNVNGDNVHADHHALWVNPKRAGHIINGNDGGVNISYDSGASWFKCNNPSVGQFYAINVDEAEPYNVYGGLQDNGVWVGPSTYEPSTRWHNTGDYPYDMLLGGDGMKVMIDNRGNNTVYTGFQFGFYFRVDKTTGQRTRIKPQHDLGERPLRFNWQTPIWLSKHNQDILYLGSNKLHRSMNQGDDWTNISSDLTQGGRKGDVPFGTLSTLSESDFKFGLIYTGSDDGYIHVSKDGGTTWERISDKLPQNLWVSRVEASHHKEGRVYATLNGYRWDDCRPYLFVSNNYGKTWKNLGRTLPHEPINIVREDPENENIIYVGTDHALYVSLDGGQTFMGMNNGLPDVPVHDLVIHPKAKELVVGTHGRSIYVADVQHLQQLDAALMAKALHVFEVGSQKYSGYWGAERYDEGFYTIEVMLPVYLNQAGEIAVEVKDAGENVLKTLNHKGKKGLNYIKYDLTVEESSKSAYETHLNEEVEEEKEQVMLEKADDDNYYLQPGTYTITVEGNGKTSSTDLEIKK